MTNVSGKINPGFIFSPHVLVISALLVIFSGCTKKPDEFASVKFGQVRVSEPIQEAQLPEELWNKIVEMAPPPGTPPVDDKKDEASGEGKKEASEGAKKGSADGSKKESAEGGKKESGEGGKKEGGILVQQPDIPREPFSFRLQLREKTSGVLGKQNLEYQFPRGGGDLDLSRVTIPNFHGTYRLRVQYDLSLGKDEKMSVFFVPNSKPRELNGEVFGNGCHKYFDLTSFFKKTVTVEGLDLNTTDQRDASAISGTYFFVMPRGNLLYMSYMTITDTQHPQLACRGNSP